PSGQGFGPRIQRRATKESNPRRTLDDSARTDISKLNDVNEVYPDVRFMAQVKRANEAWKPQWQELPKYEMVAALPLSARDRDAFENMKGKFFSNASADEAVLQMESAKQFDAEHPDTLIGQEITVRFPQRKSLDDSNATPRAENASLANLPPEAQAAVAEMASGYSVVIQEQRLRVVGIVEAKPDNIFRGAGNGGIYIPVDFAETLNPMQTGDQRATVAGPMTGQRYSALVVRVNKTSRVEAVEDSIKKMGLNTFSLLDASRNLRRAFRVLDLFVGIFGSLALAVASLGIINTLVMSILERRREIGIMKAIGASDSDVRHLFFFEAGAMGLFGGLLGVLFGWIIGHVINFGTRIWANQQADFTLPNIWLVPWWLVAFGIGFSIIVSLISGLYPATRAARLDPVQALRYE